MATPVESPDFESRGTEPHELYVQVVLCDIRIFILIRYRCDILLDIDTISIIIFYWDYLHKSDKTALH